MYSPQSSIFTLFLLLCCLMGLNAQYPYGVVQPVQDRVITTNCINIYGQLNKTYNNLVSIEKPVVYVFHVKKSYIQNSHVSEPYSLQKSQLRIEVAVAPKVLIEKPILFAVRQQRFISTMEVPYRFDKNASASVFYHAARTLCIENDGEARNVTVRVSTQSTKLIEFELILKLTDDIQLRLNRDTSFEVGPTTPKYFRFSFARPDLHLVKIRASSETTNCMTMSIQTVDCPIYDLQHNVRYQGLWQTMSTSAAMTVEKRGHYTEGFVLVFVAHTSNELCGRKDSLSTSHSGNRSTEVYGNFGHPVSLLDRSINDPRSKTVKLRITDESKIAWWIILWCLLLPIIVTLLICLAVLALFRNRHEWMVKILREKFQQDFPMASTPFVVENTIGEPPSDDDIEEQTNLDRMLRLSQGSSQPPLSPRVRPTSGIKKGEGGNRSDSAWKANLCIADFKCKEYKDVKKFSKRFYWTIGIVAIFYSIPVYQLVIHYLRVLYKTGEYDICYYNYLCAQRLGVLIDFNHFWSNASYVIFGFLFIAIIRRRRKNLYLPQNHKKQSAASNGDPLCCCCCSCYSPGKVGRACLCTFSKISFRWDHGVPAHFGVFYALGVALAMEGFLSAAYHLCPNQSTFQFDTCFMYVIAVLLLLKIYQFRHPVHFGANHTFAILAGFVAISVIGLMFERGTDLAVLIFKCIFLTLQYIVMIVLCTYYYAVGHIRDENNELVTDWSLYTRLGQLKGQKIHADRLYLPIISLAICVAVLIYSELSDIGFASYLLYVLVGNVLGTTLYYVGIMKPLHGEFKNRTWVQPTLYFLAAGVIGGLSLQYFVRAPAQWELSASASRAENEDCLSTWFPFHPFYDSHDAWHFMSAAALFLAFMGLLIVDDDLITTPQTEIPVF